MSIMYIIHAGAQRSFFVSEINKTGITRIIQREMATIVYRLERLYNCTH